MKKFATYCFYFVLAIVIVLVGGINILPGKISKELSQTMGVPVSIGSIPFSLNPVGIDKLEIKNPKEFNDLPRALSVKSIRVHAPITHYTKDPIEIEEITLTDCYLGLQTEGSIASFSKTNGNWQTIINYKDPNAKPKPKAKEDKESAAKVVRIKKLILKNLQVDLYQGTGPVKHLLPIDEITLKDIDSSKGVPMNQVITALMPTILKQTAADALNGKDSVKDKLKGFFSK